MPSDLKKLNDLRKREHDLDDESLIIDLVEDLSNQLSIQRDEMTDGQVYQQIYAAKYLTRRLRVALGINDCKGLFNKSGVWNGGYAE